MRMISRGDHIQHFNCVLAKVWTLKITQKWRESEIVNTKVNVTTLYTKVNLMTSVNVYMLSFLF